MSKIILRITGLVIVIEITIMNAFGLASTVNISSEMLHDSIYEASIHTVILKSSQWEFSLPVIEIASGESLELRFDDLSAVSRNLAYTLIHCDAQWSQSDLTQGAYLSGFGNGTIRDVFTSFNTTYTYNHYRLIFPEEDCMPLISGNYAVVVYEENDPEHIVLTRRFYVTEKSVNIEPVIKRPAWGLERESGQQVLFSVNYNPAEIRDPLNDVIAVVMQNGRHDRKIILQKPFSIHQGILEYTDPEKGIFSGGNEFRSLDIKNIRYQTENIAEINFENPYYHIYLKPDFDRAGKPYFSKTDLNGSFYIDMEKANDRHTEADYVLVHFSLSLPILYTTDRVYVSGAFSDWHQGHFNQMKYNDAGGIFEATILLKQGLYDYCYLIEDTGTMQSGQRDIEGEFYETENDYAIFMYFHDHRGYDRILGYVSIK